MSLTSITDEMLLGAPSPEEAVDAFLDWAGDRPLVAHNAEFERWVCPGILQETGRSFDPLWTDTLSWPSTCDPELNNHKLDTGGKPPGAASLPPPPAFDDAGVCGQIFWRLLPRLRQAGVERLAQVNPTLAGMKKADGDAVPPTT